jgi:hypothetical protein
MDLWHSETAISRDEALKLYGALCKREWMPTGEHPGVVAFYQELCSRYPEIDTLPESELERCPRSCTHDKSGRHVITCMNYGDELEPAPQFVTELASRHGLICFDPQGPNVYLPPNRSRFRFW